MRLYSQCKNCKHFLQHYVVDKRFILIKTNDGHCVARRGYNCVKNCTMYEETNNEQLAFDLEFVCCNLLCTIRLMKGIFETLGEMDKLMNE